MKLDWRRLRLIGCMAGSAVALGAWVFSQIGGPVVAEVVPRVPGFQTPDQREQQERELSLAGGVAPPGARGLAAAATWSGIPKRLAAAIAQLDSTQRLRVRTTARNDADVPVLVTLTQVGSAFELVTVEKSKPKGPRNVVTVVDGVAYIDDVGLRFDRQRQRYRIRLHDQFHPGVFVRWWDMTRVNDRGVTWTATVGPHDGETTFVGIRGDDLARHRFVVTKHGWLRESPSPWASTSIEQIPAGLTIGAPAWAAGPDDPVPTTWAEALAADPSLTTLLDRVVEVTQGSPLDDGNDAGALESQCGSPPYTPFRHQGAPLPARSLFRCQINLTDLPAGSGLPTRGLLQFYLQEFDGFVRYIPEPNIGDHDADAALRLVEEAWQDLDWGGRPFPAFRITFATGHTSSDDAIYSRGPRKWRYTRAYKAFPDTELAKALVPLGIRYVDNDVDLMGGRWLANGRTPDRFVRLFMIGDDTGYSYWHIPTKDLAVGRFNRVQGGWTD